MMHSDADRKKQQQHNGAHTSKGREFELLLCLSRTQFSPETEDKIKTLVNTEIDWQYLVDCADAHRLAPLIYRAVKRTCSDNVPKRIYQALRSHYQRGAQRNLVLTGALVKVLELLESENIAAVPYKGPALASPVYGDLNLRGFGDLDLIILETDVKRAKTLLVNNGFRWIPQPEQYVDHREPQNILFSNEYVFVAENNSALIDLHWGISKPSMFPFLFDFTALWPRLEQVILVNKKVRQFPPSELLLFLCVHGCKDLWWLRLAWICDIAELIRARPDINWQDATGQAERLGARRMLFLGLCLAHELLQAPVPREIVCKIETDPAVARLSAEVKRKLFHRRKPWSRNLERSVFHIKVRERWRDKLTSSALYP